MNYQDIIDKFLIGLKTYINDLANDLANHLNLISRTEYRIIFIQKQDSKYKAKIQITDDINILNYLIMIEEADEGLLNNILYSSLDSFLAEKYEDMISLKAYIDDDSLILEISLPIIKKITKEDLDELSGYNWDMIPIDRRIDQSKVKLYLDNISDKEIKYIAETIILNTHYINFETFKKDFIKLTEQLPDKFNIAFIYDPNYSIKIGSEHWIVMILWPIIRHRVIKLINTSDDIDNEYPIVIFDDATYSGQKLIKDISYFQYDYNVRRHSEKGDYVTSFPLLDIGLEQTIKNTFLKNEFIIAIPYMSVTSIYRLNLFRNNVNINIKVVYIQLIYPFIMLLQKIENSPYDFSDTDRMIGIMRQYFNAWDTNVAIYSDHKIAGPFSSFPDIYKQIVRELPSRNKIEELNQIINN